MKKFLLAILLLVLVGITKESQAVVLLQEDFNDAPNSTALPPFGTGVPVTPGADNNWFAYTRLILMNCDVIRGASNVNGEELNKAGRAR